MAPVYAAISHRPQISDDEEVQTDDALTYEGYATQILSKFTTELGRCAVEVVYSKWCSVRSPSVTLQPRVSTNYGLDRSSVSTFFTCLKCLSDSFSNCIELFAR